MISSGVTVADDARLVVPEDDEDEVLLEDEEEEVMDVGVEVRLDKDL